MHDLKASKRRGRGAIVVAVSAGVLVAVGAGAAWALSVTKQEPLDVSASYVIRVGVNESKAQRLFRVGQAVLATECAGSIDNGAFAVGGKALTITNTGSDPILVWDNEGVNPVGGSPGPITLAPGDEEAFGVVGVAATVNDNGTGGLLPLTVLDQTGRSATGTYSFWYDADSPSKGTCVISAQMGG